MKKRRIGYVFEQFLFDDRSQLRYIYSDCFVYFVHSFPLNFLCLSVCLSVFLSFFLQLNDVLVSQHNKFEKNVPRQRIPPSPDKGSAQLTPRNLSVPGRHTRNHTAITTKYRHLELNTEQVLANINLQKRTWTCDLVFRFRKAKSTSKLTWRTE